MEENIEVQGRIIRSRRAGLRSTEHLLVLAKPAGLLAVPGRGEDQQDCLSLRAQRLWPDARVVHRLDMATSGLFLMARGLAMQRLLSRAFEERAVDKRYEAVVTGVLPGADRRRSTCRWRPTGRTGRCRRWIRPQGRPATRAGGAGAGAAARTRWRWNRSPAAPTSCACTCRRSAIRSSAMRSTPRPRCGLAPRLLLHACALRLAHPATRRGAGPSTAPAPF
jgi:tRNA pseudouridine32 synthase/23S rRNA pseudouridine746 synthase